MDFGQKDMRPFSCLSVQSLKYLPLLLIVLLLSACGFHLRGIMDTPEWLDNVAIIYSDGNKELASKLEVLLEGYEIEINPEPAQAAYWLVINKSVIQRHIVSIGASTNPRQYQLIMTTEFTLKTPKGQIIKARGNITVNRQLTVNNDRILGSNEEENVLISEMRQDTAVQIMNRLSRE